MRVYLALGISATIACSSAAWAQKAPAQPPVLPPAALGSLAVSPAKVTAPPAAMAPTTVDADSGAIRVLLTPELETTLVSQMVGRIVTLNASLGAKVPKGRTLVAFDCSESQARLQMAQAEQAGARETLDVKTRLLRLEAAGESEVTLAAAAMERTNAAIALSRSQLSQCNVIAPFAGRVVRVHVKLHQGVSVGNPLIELVSDGPLKLRLNAPSRLLRTLRVGTPFEVMIDDTGKTYAAEVTAINARVDAVAQTVELEGRIAGKPADLLAGMTGAARFKSAP